MRSRIWVQFAPGRRSEQLVKITAIKSFVCNARMRNWIFVKDETDQPGLVGWGEATLEWHTRSVVGAIEDLTTLLIGEDPGRIAWIEPENKYERPRHKGRKSQVLES